jgi:hypothetical protein
MRWLAASTPDQVPDTDHVLHGLQLAGSDKVGSRASLENEISAIRLRLREIKGEQSRLEAALANLEREMLGKL